MQLNSNETLYSHKTWEYIAKTEIKFEILLAVIVSMVIV